MKWGNEKRSKQYEPSVCDRLRLALSRRPGPRCSTATDDSSGSVRSVPLMSMLCRTAAYPVWERTARSNPLGVVADEEIVCLNTGSA